MVAAMTRIAPLALLALAALSIAVAAAPAAAAERRFTITDFDRIVVEGPYTVRLDTGRAPSASATGSAQALDAVAIDVEGRTLRVRSNRSAWGGYPGAAAAPATIALSSHSIRAASVNGAGQLLLGRVGGLRLDLNVQGTGRIAAPEIAADQLVLGLIGSGRMELAGSAREIRASVHGWTDLDGAALTSQGLVLITDTAGRVALSAARQATVTAAGIGEVEISGTAACTVHGVSAGQVRCGSARR
jgi:hypothetical protein